MSRRKWSSLHFSVGKKWIKIKRKREARKEGKNVVLCGLNPDLGGAGEIIVELLTAN